VLKNTHGKEKAHGVGCICRVLHVMHTARMCLPCAACYAHGKDVFVVFCTWQMEAHGKYDIAECFGGHLVNKMFAACIIFLPFASCYAQG